MENCSKIGLHKTQFGVTESHYGICWNRIKHNYATGQIRNINGGDFLSIADFPKKTYASQSGIVLILLSLPQST